jgi:hypothetical protein
MYFRSHAVRGCTRGGASALGFCVIAMGWLCAQEISSSGKASSENATILGAIRALESKSDPKCHATASRLQNMVCGTPLSDGARFQKNRLTRALSGRIWTEAAALGLGKATSVDSEAINKVLEIYPRITEKEGDWSVRLQDGEEVIISHRDKRQFASIAYSLRAILGAEQELWLDESKAKDLPALTNEAVETLREAIDVYQLVVLDLADRSARKANRWEISAQGISDAWKKVGLPSDPTHQGSATSPNVGAPGSFDVLKKIITEKVAAYAAYNEISNQIFIRNLQVYFARRRWPADPTEGKAVRRHISQAIINFAADLYGGAEALARARGDRLVRERDVSQFAQSFVAHRINEFEDAVYFPNLERSQQVVIESYDMDSFRDSGLHWRYLQFALEDPLFKGQVGADPFAGELLAENIAQFGVLMLRLAGQHAIRQGDDRLAVRHIDAGLRHLQERILAHGKAKPQVGGNEAITSAAATTIPSSPSDKELFSEVSAEMGIVFNHRSSDWLNRQMRSYLRTGPETGNITIPPAFGGSGIAAEDVNHDGWPDLLILSGLGNRLYLNEAGNSFRDITKDSGIFWTRSQDNTPGEPRQPIIADFDNDGHQDLLITYVDDNHRLYRGHGDGTFDDVTDGCRLGGAGLVGGPATALDFDRDGKLDIFVGYFGNYVNGVLPTLARRNENGLPDKLFRNVGGMRFEEVAGAGVEDRGWGQAAGHTDLNGDGWQDLIVGNDFGVNGYYLNLKNGKFREVSATLGTDKPSYTMGIGIADLNRDRYPDLYISNIVTMNKDQKYVLPNKDTPQTFDPDKLANMRVIEGNDLFLSSRREEATDGLPAYENSELVERGYSATGWSWDADFFDSDNDGDDDLYVLNGMNEFNIYARESSYNTDPLRDEDSVVQFAQANAEKNVFFVNEGGRLQERSAGSGLDFVSNARSAAYLDFDGDGLLDIAINNYHGPVMLFRNQGTTGRARQWLEIQLEGDPTAGATRDAIGAKIEVVGHPESNLKRIWREVHSTIGYLSVHPKAQHFGVGTSKLVSVAVTWPDQTVQRFENVKSGRRYHLKQGEPLQRVP